MGSFPSNDSTRGPCSKTARRHDPSQSLYDHANRFLLSVVGCVSNRYVLPPAAVENHRDRPVLAQLLEIVTPQEADRISRDLLAEFGSIGRMLDASEASLRRVVGANGAVIKLIKASKKFMLAHLQSEVPRPLISTTDHKLVNYLRARMGSNRTEIMRVIFLDSSNHLLCDQEFGTGSTRRLFVQPRNILKRALEIDASGIILVHNHPGGDITPSNSDIEFTKSIETLCSKLEIRLLDHIIIASDRWTSFRKLQII